MTKDHWKAATFLSVAALIVTLAASHYTRRTLETELADARARLLDQPAVVEEPEPDALPVPPQRSYAPVAAPRSLNERCINGQLFQKDAGGAWSSVGQRCS